MRLMDGNERLQQGSGSSRSCVMATEGMVASSNPLATEAGLSVLKSGGNAMDAAIAVGAALAVVEPCSTGLGGDGFCLYYSASDKKVSAVNGSGRCPGNLTIEKVVESYKKEGFDSLPPSHPHTATVPGVVAMWIDCLQKFGSGSVSREQIFESALRYAKKGFPVAPVCSAAWKESEGSLKSAPNGEEILSAGKAPTTGSLFKRPEVFNVLSEIVKSGKDGFYKGWVAEAITSTLQGVGSVMSQDDLDRHTTSFINPISTEFLSKTVYGHPPNGQGITALIALNIIKEELKKRNEEDRQPFGSVSQLHLQLEALRLAFADAKEFVTDPEYGGEEQQKNYADLIESLLSQKYASNRSDNISQERAMTDEECRHGQPLKDSCTVSFQVVDVHGNAVSMVNSNYMGFGTGIVPKGTGFTLQNRGYNFSLDPSHKNALAPNKRPYHTIIPCITTNNDGTLHSTFTNMGGFMQPQGHVQHLLNMLLHEMDPQQSIDAPRFCILNDSYSGVFGQVAYEGEFSSEVIEKLKAMGHNMQPVNGMQRAAFGRAQIIVKLDNGVLVAGSDARADGCAMGY